MRVKRITGRVRSKATHMPRKVKQSHIGGAMGTKKGIPKRGKEAFTYTEK